jgi:hypothetical protein
MKFAVRSFDIEIPKAKQEGAAVGQDSVQRRCAIPLKKEFAVSRLAELFFYHCRPKERSGAPD